MGKLRLGLIEVVTEFCLFDLNRTMKTIKFMFYGLVNIDYMIMGHNRCISFLSTHIFHLKDFVFRQLRPSTPLCIGVK